MLGTPFSPWPSFSREEADAVRDLLLSNRVNYWTGEEGRSFEREFAAWVGTTHAVALTNGTLAIDLALRAADVGPGDDVIVTPRTFLASVSCVINAGARPIFADVDADSQNITAETIRAVLTPATKAILPVHLAGWPCEMDAIMALANERRLLVIEDCAQAHGARYRGRRVGSFGYIGAWSFCQDKIITTGGEGGMVTTDDAKAWERMWSYKDHGKSWRAVYEDAHPPGFRWVHETFGTNWRMLEVQAVIGRMQLKRVDGWVEKRAANARRIAESCRPFDVLRVPMPPPHVTHAYYRLDAFVRPQRLAPGWSRDRIVAEINSRSVPCYHGSCPEVYLEKAFDGTGLRPSERLPVARELGETSVRFLVHPNLTDAEIEKTCAVVRQVLKLASK
jgi:dTDP-4-amino-4,6-dideoxygalactose transaminase